MESDRVFFARRADEERAAAAEARDKNAKQSHLQLADDYERMSAALMQAEKAAQPG